MNTAAETRSTFGDPEFAGEVVLQTVPVWLMGSEGQSVLVNHGSDST